MLENSTSLTMQEVLLGGSTRVRNSFTLATIGGRATNMAPFTVLGLNPATNKIEPWKSNMVTGGLYHPVIYIGDTILAATIAAGDVTGISAVVGGDCLIREDALVFELGGDTLDTAFGTAPNNTTARQLLARLGVFTQITATATA